MNYYSAHDRVRRLRGRASHHRCNICGGRADEWALRPNAANTLVGPAWRQPNIKMRYSVDPNDYVSLCRRCHKRMDVDAKRVKVKVIQCKPCALCRRWFEPRPRDARAPGIYCSNNCRLRRGAAFIRAVFNAAEAEAQAAAMVERWAQRRREQARKRS